MKRLLAVLLTSCMIAGLASPAGAGIWTELKANTDAALNNMSGSSEHTEVSAEGSGSFDKALSDLYDNSMSATDEDVIASAKQMDSDFSAIESKIGTDAGDLIDCLKYYEASKSRYIAGSDDKSSDFDGKILKEWDRQGEYTSYVMPETDEIRTAIPKIKVTECSVDGKSAKLDIYEWMTIGYAPSESEEINAAAYGYNFSLNVNRDRKGAWTIDSVDDTDQNFDWMEEEAEYAAKAEASAYNDKQVISEDGSREMMAAAAARSYTYNVSKAIAYADKYCINYNPSYNSYKGRGGDCANFVSQCLYAGGFQQDSDWFKHSVAWINVMRQIAHFKAYGNFLNAQNGNLIKGNPIYFDWNGDGVYDHATICVGRNNSGTAILDSHTRDLYHATWTNWSFRKAATIQLHGSGSSSSASEGTFKRDSNGKYYVYSDGSRIRSCFKTIKGLTYYFNSKGYVARGLNRIGGKIYIFNKSSGVMYKGWTTYNKKKYYLGSDGAAYTEWNEIGPHTYYFNPKTGVMVTGFYRVKTKLHHFTPAGIEQFGWITVSGKKYYLDEWGVVQFGWQVVSGKKYYFDEKGAMVTGNAKIDGVIYTFDKNGVCKGKASAGASVSRVFANGKEIVKKKTAAAAAKPSSAAAPKKTGKTGWESSGGKWRYYKNGTLVKGWLRLGKNKNRVFYLDSNGNMVTGLKKIGAYHYYFDKEGLLKKGWVKIGSSWYYFLANGRMKTGWLKLGSRYFYLQKNGKMKTGWLKDTDGNWYYLNYEGAMVTGRQVIQGKVYYFGNMGNLLD